MAERRPVKVLGVELPDATWYAPIKQPAPAGTPTKKLVEIPQRHAQQLLRSVVRLVADLPAGSPPRVVWTQGSSELLVHTSTISIACAPGLVTIGLRVACDQLAEPTTLSVPFAVGTRQAPAGLVMHTFTRLAGPAVVTERWSEAVTAFAWEALVELARALCAELGRDEAGRALVPGAIGADQRLLLLQPMGRHRVNLRPPDKRATR